MLSSSGTLLKTVSQITLTGTLTTAGALVKTPIKVLAGTLTSSGALVRSVTKLLASALSHVLTLGDGFFDLLGHVQKPGIRANPEGVLIELKIHQGIHNCVSIA